MSVASLLTHDDDEFLDFNVKCAIERPPVASEGAA
jgi:hypothetical protein